ncbi:MATE family efflux transporter [Sphingomonas sp. MMS24-J13]|uniref:MATE family efflux transporter n=1 Tax=Sphingomonas sp. MMS24-J13 TaxID=3238686 RepID=UPI00384FA35A
MTEGSLWRSVATIAVPVVLTNLLQATYQFVNGYFLGHAGRDALAAVSASAPMFGVLLALGLGLATAGSVFIAQYAGARRTEMVDHVAAQTLLSVGAVGLGFMAIGLIGNGALIRLIGLEPEIGRLTHAYLSVSYLGMVPMFGFMTAQAMLQSLGDARYPLRVMVASVVLNAVLDPILIFGWGPIPALGVVGAAISTVTAQVMTCVLGLARLAGGRSGVSLRLHHFRPDFPHIRRAIGIGIPASIEQATRTFGSLVLMSLAARFGTNALAIYGLGTRIMIFFFVPMLGLSVATAAVVGQNIGAGQMARAEAAARGTALAAFLMLTAIGLLLVPAAPYLIAFMAPGQPTILVGTVHFLHIFGPSLGIMALPQVLNGAFRGAGSTRQAMGISLVMQWLMQMPCALVLALWTPLGLDGVMWSFPIANVLASLLAIGWLIWGPWRRTLIDPAEVRDAVTALRTEVEEEILPG